MEKSYEYDPGYDCPSDEDQEGKIEFFEGTEDFKTHAEEVIK